MEEKKINTNKQVNNGGFESFLKQMLDGSLLTGKFISQHILYILFIVGLSMGYIYNRYRTDDLVLKISETHKEIRKLRSESVINASKLMIINRESQVNALIEEKKIELKKLEEPVIEIIYKDE